LQFHRESSLLPLQVKLVCEGKLKFGTSARWYVACNSLFWLHNIFNGLFNNFVFI
jgi:hypothetical protein